MQTHRGPGRKKADNDSDIQLNFDFADERPASDPTGGVAPLELRRAVLGWLLALAPTAIGVMVPTRIAKCQADVAAFWAEPDRRRILQPVKTLAVEIRRDREQCWPDCARKDELLPQLKELKQEKARLEALIREREPHLQDTDSLFDEFENWRYAETSNPDYAQCLKRIDGVEHTLYRGSRFEQIRSAKVADLLYLAVPAGTVHADELADGWGLLEISPRREVCEVRTAEFWDCPRDRRLHLAQHIAASCRNSLLFAHGIRQDKDGAAVFTPVPHRRRKAARS
jgi:hypothetical protein